MSSILLDPPPIHVECMLFTHFPQSNWCIQSCNILFQCEWLIDSIWLWTPSNEGFDQITVSSSTSWNIISYILWIWSWISRCWIEISNPGRLSECFLHGSLSWIIRLKQLHPTMLNLTWTITVVECGVKLTNQTGCLIRLLKMIWIDFSELIIWCFQLWITRSTWRRSLQIWSKWNNHQFKSLWSRDWFTDYRFMTPVPNCDIQSIPSASFNLTVYLRKVPGSITTNAVKSSYIRRKRRFCCSFSP